MSCSLVPTVQLSWHPGHGPSTRIVPDSTLFKQILVELCDVEENTPPRAVMTGYFADAEQVYSTAEAIRSLRASCPDVLFFCDPVLGDGSSLYVAEDVAIAIRDELIPICDVLTPNRFELSWLLEMRPSGSMTSIREMADRLGIDTMLVTSCHGGGKGLIGNLLVHQGEGYFVEHPSLDKAPKGTGDFLASAFLGRLLLGEDHWIAMERAISSTLEIIEHSRQGSCDELQLAGNQSSVVAPKKLLKGSFLRSVS